MLGALSRIRARPGLWLLNALYAGIGLYWVFLLPYNSAPDEATHFEYSVEFLRTQRRLPVWGVDDVERFRHAISSYNHMPALNYVVAACAAEAGVRGLGLEPFRGARLASLAWGLVFLNGLYAALSLLAGRPGPALLATAAFALIPQVLYTFCYVNNDAHSLGIAALLAWALARTWVRPSRGSFAALGAAAGLLFSAKYNYFFYAPFLAAAALALAARGRVPWPLVLRAGLAAACGAILVSGFWYARNLALYGAVIPTWFSPDALAARGIVPAVTPVNRGVSLDSLAWLLRQRFPATTFVSFFGLFGYLDVAFPPAVYAALFVVVPALAALILVELVLARDRALAAAGLWLAAFGLTLLTLHATSSLWVDVQPQGRYQFVSLVPAAVYLGWAAARRRRLCGCLLALAAVQAVLLGHAVALFHRTYRPPLQFALFWDAPDGPRAAISRAEPVERNRIRVAFRVEEPRPIGELRLAFPKRILARYRRVALRLDDGRDTRVLAGAERPDPRCEGMRYDPAIDALDAAGPDPSAAFRLDPPPAGVQTVRVDMAVERRRLTEPAY